MILLILFVFAFIFLVSKGNRSILIYLILIQIVSLIGAMLIGQDYIVDTFSKGFNLIFTILILSLILYPWIKVDKINSITVCDEFKIKRLTFVLIAISVIPFITFMVMSIYVFKNTENIYFLKSIEGSLQSLYSTLPINSKLFVLSVYLLPVSNFLIPLNIYYLGKKEYKLSFICFVLSLNTVLYGLSYYSRSAVIHYIFIYLACIYLLQNTLYDKTMRYMRKFMFLFVAISTLYLFYITNERFSSNSFYSGKISQQSIVQNPVIFSALDYLSQWYYNSMFLLDEYKFKTFKGQITFHPILSLVGHYNLINYNSNDFQSERMALWPNHWYSFNGLVAYSVFDYGYILTILLSTVYFYFVSISRPINNSISINRLFLLVLLIQIPLMAIFYSMVEGIVMPLLFLIPIYAYLATRRI